MNEDESRLLMTRIADALDALTRTEMGTWENGKVEGSLIDALDGVYGDGVDEKWMSVQHAPLRIRCSCSRRFGSWGEYVAHLFPSER